MIEILNRYTKAVLYRADVADVRAAVLQAVTEKADLSEADLSEADLSGADLSEADLSEADLSSVKRDIMAVLDASPHEVLGLRDAVAGGRIDGSCYTGECCCLVGTLAKLRKVGISDLPGRLPDASSPAERWFLALRPGHTSESSQVAAITLRWIDEWLAEHAAPATKESAADPTP